MPWGAYRRLNSLTAGPGYIRFHILLLALYISAFTHGKGIKRDINQQDLKINDPLLSNPNIFYSLEVVDRVSETQRQVGENSNWTIWWLSLLTEVTVSAANR